LQIEQYHLGGGSPKSISKRKPLLYSNRSLAFKWNRILYPKRERERSISGRKYGKFL
jgi:hypothetical protein